MRIPLIVLALTVVCAASHADAGDAEVHLTGYVQSDFRDYRDWSVEDGLRAETSEVPRRARIGVEGEWRALSFEAQADPDDGTEHLKDLWGEVRVSRGLRLRLGNFKLPVSAERLTSAAKTDFVERSRLADELAPGRDWGLMAHGEVGKVLDYQAGVFLGDARTLRSRAGTTGAARLVLHPTGSLDLGISVAAGRVEADDEAVAADPVARGLRGFSASRFLLWEPHFVDGQRRRVGLEAAFTRGPLAFRAEALQVRESRQGQGSDCTAGPAAASPAETCPACARAGWPLPRPGS